jgi:hypothetical protein
MSNSVDPSSTGDGAVRVKAIIALVIAVVMAFAGWFGLSTATQRGVDRLEAIERVRGGCDQAWRVARNHTDTLRVDELALPDTIDPMSDQAIDQCGDLRDKSASAREPNPREMSGEPMPRGLR